MRQTPPTGPSSATGGSVATGVGAGRGVAAAAALGLEVATAVEGGALGAVDGAGAPWQPTAMTRRQREAEMARRGAAPHRSREAAPCVGRVPRPPPHRRILP